MTTGQPGCPYLIFDGNCLRVVLRYKVGRDCPEKVVLVLLCFGRFPPSRIRSEIGRRASGIVIDCLPLSQDFICFGMVGRKHYLLGGREIAIIVKNIVIFKTKVIIEFIDLCNE